MTIAKHRKNLIQWGQALESGEYKQGMGRLCSLNPKGEERHCCIGVALEEFGSAKIGWELGENGSCYSWEGDWSNPPPEFMACTFGLFWDDSEYLIDLNDNKKYGFKRIAKIIRNMAGK